MATAEADSNIKENAVHHVVTMSKSLTTHKCVKKLHTLLLNNQSVIIIGHGKRIQQAVNVCERIRQKISTEQGGLTLSIKSSIYYSKLETAKNRKVPTISLTVYFISINNSYQ